MGDGREALDRLPADPLRRTVRREKIGMRRFELLQFLQQSVEFEIGDLRLRLDVVQVVVMVQLFAEFRGSLLCRVCLVGRRRGACRVRPS